MLKTQKIKYEDANIVLEGYCAIDSAKSGKRPAVLVAHDWSGRNEFADQKAEKLAELGYVGFAIDMFGIGKIGKTKEEKSALIKPLLDDRGAIRERLLCGLEAVKKIPEVDSSRIGAIGFCFGGLCVLDLARSGADVKGVVSFHGILNPPDLQHKKILSKILVLHGHDDPMVPPEQVLAFEKEMTKETVDWQVNVYSNTMHAFMNPGANDPGFGTVHNPEVEKRAWLAMENFFAEALV